MNHFLNTNPFRQVRARALQETQAGCFDDAAVTRIAALHRLSDRLRVPRSRQHSRIANRSITSHPMPSTYGERGTAIGGYRQPEATRTHYLLPAYRLPSILFSRGHKLLQDTFAREESGPCSVGCMPGPLSHPQMGPMHRERTSETVRLQ